MRIATYNLRFDSQPDSITVQETLDSLEDPLQEPIFLEVETEQPWSTRRIRVAEQVLSEGVAIVGEGKFEILPRVSSSLHGYVGFQEALPRQVNDLAELFGHNWSWVCYPAAGWIQ